MRNSHVMLAAALLVAVGANAASGEPNSGKTRPQVPLGNNPHPVIWGGQQTKAPTPAPQLAARSTGGDCDGHHHRAYRSGHFSGGLYRYDAYYYGYSDPYYYYAYPSLYYAYPPPVWISAENAYGPRAVMRFMGAGGSDAVSSPVNILGLPIRNNVNADAPEPRGVDRATNAQANALAWRFIGFGDAQFAQQKYVDANARYRKAVSAAPQLADARFRQGFALTAINRYEQAVTAMKRGLKINPNWAKSGFKIKDLYGDDELAKDAYLDALSTAADKNPNDANLLFLLGVNLHFDGQADRAKVFFDRATELAGGDAEHIRAFLKE
jgi:tetratricopeptide (TPR) repeat protein